MMEFLLTDYFFDQAFFISVTMPRFYHVTVLEIFEDTKEEEAFEKFIRVLICIGQSSSRSLPYLDPNR